MSAREVRFGVIGLGLMGREFASAAARWCHLPDLAVRPLLVGICDANPALFDWYRGNFPSIRTATSDYRELLARPEVEAVYVAVPHHLHREVYVEVLKAGKHLMGEKPFGIDLAASREIGREIAGRPGQFVRCSSEFPYFPGVQRIVRAIAQRRFGRILEVNAGFLHSSDLDPEKPINWKRRAESCGEYGCLGDLGMHVLHVPLRAGWRIVRLYAQLQKIVAERPDGKGGRAACTTWDNGRLTCDAVDPADGSAFPLTLKVCRIAPGETDSWYLEILGTRLSMRYSTRTPKTLESLEYERGRPQAWQQESLGYESVYPAITGGIFEFGFPDAILQMWASYLDELVNGSAPYGCVRPEEAHRSHELFTAALESQRAGRAVEV
jgi:predicted dehydrogenase